eukprot:6211918-Amphidinium_carterae.1
MRESDSSVLTEERYIRPARCFDLLHGRGRRTTPQGWLQPSDSPRQTVYAAELQAVRDALRSLPTSEHDLVICLDNKAVCDTCVHTLGDMDLDKHRDARLWRDVKEHIRRLPNISFRKI